MNGDPARDEIARLEEQIEEIAGSLDRCRKLHVASQAAIVAGAILFVLMIAGVVSFAPLNLLGAIAAVLGGIVVFGSNTTTRQQFADALREAESRRDALIDALRMQDISSPRLQGPQGDHLH